MKKMGSENGWREVKLGDVCTLGDDAHIKVKRLESGVLYLSSKNIQNGKINLDSVTYCITNLMMSMRSKMSYASNLEWSSI